MESTIRGLRVVGFRVVGFRVLGLGFGVFRLWRLGLSGAPGGRFMV